MRRSEGLYCMLIAVWVLVSETQSPGPEQTADWNLRDYSWCGVGGGGAAAAEAFEILTHISRKSYPI